MGFQPYKENRHEYWRSIDNGEIIRKWGFLNTIVAINVYLITSYKVAFYGFLSNWLSKFLKTINNSSWVSTNQPCTSLYPMYVDSKISEMKEVWKEWGFADLVKHWRKSFPLETLYPPSSVNSTVMAKVRLVLPFVNLGSSEFSSVRCLCSL